ncbi:MAG: AAA family ATPase [Rickettsiales bacterium]|nr:AAA family ATPase [Rickettsiales bacterium]
MSLFSPLLIICHAEARQPALAEMAQALGYSDAHIVTGGFAEAAKALTARNSSPDYIIIDIDNNAEGVLAALDMFATHCEPNVRVVVLGDVNDVGFYRALKQRGVVEYFTHPADPKEIREVLLQVIPSHNHVSMGVARQGRVISCMSAASGDGSSTIAINLAYSLANDYHQSTVLVDLDYQFGLISKSLDLTAPFGIRELFDYPDRGVDHTLINKMLVQYHDRLSIIAAPNDLKLLPAVRLETIRELISFLRTQFAFVIIDVPHVWMEWTAASLTYSDHVLMVAQLWLRSLTHSSRLLSAWQQIGIERGDISLLINRSGAKFKEAITAQDFERICRHKIDAYVNNDVKAITFAENNAKTLFETDQGVLLQQQIRELARMMVARYQPSSLKETVSAESQKKGLLGLLEKNKK